MTDVGEWLRVLGVNGGVLAAVSLTDLELALKILLLAMTCVWTAVKIVKLIKKNEGQTEITETVDGDWRIADRYGH